MAALDARFLIDVHFRQGSKDKKDPAFLADQAEAKDSGGIPQSVIPTPQWHKDEEDIGGYEHSKKDKH